MAVAEARGCDGKVPQFERCLVSDGYWSCPWWEGFVRWLLLQAEHALRGDAIGSVRHISAESARGSAASEPVALQLSPGAAAAGCLVVPVRQRAGGAAR